MTGEVGRNEVFIQTGRLQVLPRMLEAVELVKLCLTRICSS